MPLRDRKAPAKPRTSETLVQLEQQVQAIGKQLSERFELLQVPQQQEVDRKTARQAVEYEREHEMVVLPFRHWDPGAIINAKSLADEGDLEMATDLWESALADDRVAAAMEQRINGLEGLPVRFTGDGEDVLTAISTDFWQMMKPGDRALTRRWAYGVGICPVYATEIIENGDGRQILILEPWSPRFLRWRQGAVLGKREWWIQTARGQIKLADQPGRWFLFTPFSGSNQRPWVDGLWYSTATWFLAKSFGIADLASFSQSHATPKWFLMPKEGAQISGPEKAEAIRRLAALPQRSGMYIPAGFTVEQKETTSAAWNAITALIELANKALTVRIIGTDSTTDKESSFASTAGGMQLLYVKFRTDADAESSFWHDGPLQFWYLLNFRGARKLQDRRVLDLEADPITGVYRLLDESDRRQVRRSEYGQRLRQLSEQIRGGDEVPWPTRDATPPEDMAAVAETQGKAAAALVQLAAAGTASPLMGSAIAQIDLPRFLERYFPMQAQDESGVQLQMEDGTILELGKGKTGSGWITVNGARVYAEPGKSIDFNSLKKKGGNSQKSDPSIEITEFSKLPEIDIKDMKRITPDGSTESEWEERAKTKMDGATSEQLNALRAFTGGDYATIRSVQQSSKNELINSAEKTFGRVAGRYIISDEGMRLFVAGDRSKFDKEFDAWYAKTKANADLCESVFNKVEPSGGTVFRGIAVDKSVFNRILGSKDRIVFDSTTSTSRDLSTALEFAKYESHSVLFVLKQKSAISVEHISLMSGEKELILNKGTSFKMTKKSRLKQSTNTIVVEYEEE